MEPLHSSTHLLNTNAVLFIFQTSDPYIVSASFSIAYYIVEKVLQSAFRRLWPNRYHALLKCGKAIPFFALAIRFLVIPFSVPSCYHAYKSLPIRATIDFSHPGPSEICIAARSLLWIEELSRLGGDTMYLLHHSVSLFAVSSAWWFELPGTKYLCAIVASLFTELGISATLMLAFCGLKAADHQWIWLLECVNLALIVAVRAPAAYLLFSSPWHEGLPWTKQIVWMVPAGLYVAYQTYVVFARIRKLRSAQKAWEASHSTN